MAVAPAILVAFGVLEVALVAVHQPIHVEALESIPIRELRHPRAVFSIVAVLSLEDIARSMLEPPATVPLPVTVLSKVAVGLGGEFAHTVAFTVEELALVHRPVGKRVLSKPLALPHLCRMKSYKVGGLAGNW